MTLAATDPLLSRDPVPALVDGQPVVVQTTYALNDPHTGALLYNVSASKTTDAIAAVEAAVPAGTVAFEGR